MSMRTIGLTAILIAGLPVSLTASAENESTPTVSRSEIQHFGSPSSLTDEEDCAVKESGAICWNP